MIFRKRRARSWLLLPFLLACSPALIFCQSLQSPKKAQPAKKPQSPGPLETLLAQAEEAIAKKDFPRAVEALQKYLAERPGDAYARFQIGFAYDRMAKYDEAEAEYRRAIALDPKLAAAYQNLGAILVKRKPEEARQLLATAAQLQPENAEVTFLQGIAEEGLDRPEQAIEFYRRAARARPDNFHFRLGYARKLLERGRPGDAEPEFRAAIAMNQDSPDAQRGLADCLLAQQKPAEALLPLRKYLTLEPSDGASRVQFAWLLFDGEKFEEAEAELDRAQGQGVASPAAMKLRASLLIHQHRYDDAIAAAARIVEAAPADAEWHARLGRLYLEKRQFSAAEKELLAALRIQPELTEALRDLVAVYYLAENYSAALQRMDELGQRETLNAGSWFVRATCYDKLQRKPEALAAYQKFVSLDQGRSERQDFQARQRIKVLTRELKGKR